MADEKVGFTVFRDEHEQDLDNDIPTCGHAATSTSSSDVHNTVISTPSATSKSKGKLPASSFSPNSTSHASIPIATLPSDSSAVQGNAEATESLTSDSSSSPKKTSIVSRKFSVGQKENFFLNPTTGKYIYITADSSGKGKKRNLNDVFATKNLKICFSSSSSTKNVDGDSSTGPEFPEAKRAKFSLVSSSNIASGSNVMLPDDAGPRRFIGSSGSRQAKADSTAYGSGSPEENDTFRADPALHEKQAQPLVDVSGAYVAQSREMLKDSEKSEQDPETITQSKDPTCFQETLRDFVFTFQHASRSSPEPSASEKSQKSSLCNSISTSPIKADNQTSKEARNRQACVLSTPERRALWDTFAFKSPSREKGKTRENPPTVAPLRIQKKKLRTETDKELIRVKKRL
ncbi:hypothetical protein VKT23_015515 [Stygiomarasmius scandens]|uniref:Uncharacterized protein n=1 Tax=Marasmiellus scandens TaxID=2682957 RepID=A0ABR1IXG7_9AGAR